MSSPVVLVEIVPEIQLRGDMFYVQHDHGPVMAYRANTFFAAIAAAVSESRKFKFAGAEIIQFTKDAVGH